MSFNSAVSLRFFQALLCCCLLTACAPEVPEPKPPPAQLSRDDIGYFCGMIVEDHAGPKSQVFLEGREQALWFTTVRDGIAFLRLPEETRPVTVLYVTTMDGGQWDHPEGDVRNWVEVDAAWFVIESGKSGSMGAPEAIPFADKQAAAEFAGEHGGRVLALADIPDTYILGHGLETTGEHADH
jgi:copper chaperone NosL